MNKIEIHRTGITQVGTDAIVNAANEGLWAGSGVCGAIFDAAGMDELTQACEAIGHCDTGSAVITPGFRLCRYIIHAVGPRWNNHEAGVRKQLHDCYTVSLRLAVENGCASIGFPLISSGVFGVPVDIAWEEALKACTEFRGSLRVVFAIPDSRILAKGEQLLSAMAPHPVHVTAQDRIDIFNDTQAWIKSDPDLAASVAAAKKNTQIFFEDDYPPFACVPAEQKVTVTKHRSYEAAMLLAKQHPGARIAVMNFANAIHPGGGVIKGAGAQEESLCRCSTLYPLLYRNTLRPFYDHHEALKTPRASDSLIYTEGVVICKSDESYPRRLPKEEWTSVDVITIAAPDLREKPNQYAPIIGQGASMVSAELFGYHVKRAIHMLTVAAAKKADILVLGAFGCGAFRNDPHVVARAYATALQEFPHVFRQIEFAVHCSPEDQTNYTVFKEVLEK